MVYDPLVCRHGTHCIENSFITVRLKVGDAKERRLPVANLERDTHCRLKKEIDWQALALGFPLQCDQA